MRRPTLLTTTLIATLVSALTAGPAIARPLRLPVPVAAAASGARLVVVVIPLDAGTRPLQGALEQQAQAAARAASRFEVVPLSDALEPTVTRERQTRLEDARAKMVEGQKALDDLDTPRGVELFGEALKRLKETNTANTFDELVKAWVMKAASHALGGENLPAKQEIERVVAIAPRAEFAPQFFPPELLKYVEQQRRLATAAKGELSIRTEPPGATVWVNGQLQGQSPVTVKGLLGARHQVVASLGGYALAVTELAPGDTRIELKPTESDAVWKKAVETVSKAPRSAPRDQALVALGRNLGVDEVLAVLTKQAGTGEQLELTVLRIETKDGHNAGYAAATLPGVEPEGLARVLEPVLATDAPRVNKKPVSHFDGGGDGGGSTGKVVVGLSLLGLAAGLVATGVITGVIGQTRFEEYRSTPQVQTLRLDQLRGEGLAYGAVSLSSFIAAAGATGVGIGLLATSGAGGPSAETEPMKSPKKKDASAAKKNAPRPEAPSDEAKKAEGAPKRNEPPPEEPAPKKEEPARVDPKEEKRRRDEEARVKREEEARLKKEAELRAREEAEARKKAEAEEKRRLEEERRQAEADKKGKKAAEAEEEKRRRDEEARRRDEEERRRREDEERKRREAEDKKKRDEEERRRLEEEKKKEQPPKKEEDHDDLRNY